MKTILFYTDQKYEHQALNLLKSFKVNNKLDYNFLYYTIGFKSTIEFPNLVTKEWPIDTKIPISPENNKPFFEFYKPVICLDALQDYDDICFLDTDIVISRRFTLDHLSNDKEHPLCCYCAYEYPFVYKHNDDGTTTIYNEVRLMEYYNVPKRSMRYAQTCFILFNRKCINFLKEWVSMCKNDYLLGFIENNCLIYYPSRDETAFNVCLWKHNYTDNLGHLFLNSWKIDIIKQVEEDDNIRGVEFDGNLIEYCHDSSQVILYHGLKSDPAEYAKIFEYFESRNKLKTEEKKEKGTVVVEKYSKKKASKK